MKNFFFEKINCPGVRSDLKYQQNLHLPYSILLFEFLQFNDDFYPSMKSEVYSFCRRPSIPSIRPSTLFVHRNISQYLLVRFDLFLVQMISTMDSRYPISFVKIDH